MSVLLVSQRIRLCVFLLQDVSQKYNALMDLVGKGPTTHADRMAALPAMDTFFLRRGKEELKALFPVSEKVRQALRRISTMVPFCFLFMQIVSLIAIPCSSCVLKGHE